MRSLLWALPLVVATLLAPACKTDEDGTLPTSDSIPLEQLDARQVEALCGLVFRCDSGTGGFSGARLTFRDEAECKSYFLANGSLGNEDLKLAVAAGVVRYDGVAAKKCLGAALDCSLVELSDVEQPQACRDTFLGTVALLGPCQRREECAGEAYCAATTTSTASRCPGQCAPLLPVGSQCISSTQCQTTGLAGQARCVYELTGSSFVGHCRDVKKAQPVAESATCGLDLTTYVDTPCAKGLWCDDEQNRCRLPIPVGMACGGGSDVCAGQARCVGEAPEPRTCQTTTIQRAVGLPCDERTTHCSPLDRLECQNGLCAATRPAAGPLGAACDRGDYAAPCNAGLYCRGEGTAMTCQPQVAIGQACTEFDACLAGSCVAGRCAARDCLAY